MSRRLAVPVGILGVVLLSVVVWIWWIDGHFEPIEWTAVNGSLRLYHLPAKDMTLLTVASSYPTGALRKWELVTPGATRRLVGAPKVPLPEALFHRANVVLKGSELMGLVALFDDVEARQKDQIIAEIGDACQGAADMCVQVREAAGSGRFPWLQNALGAAN